MNTKHKLQINDNGLDQVNYTVLERSGKLIAKVALKIGSKVFIIKKNAESLGGLNRKLNTAIRNLKSKSKQTRQKYSSLQMTG